MSWAYSVTCSLFIEETKTALLARFGGARTDTQTAQDGTVIRLETTTYKFLRNQVDNWFRGVGKEKGLVIPFGRGDSQRPRRWVECKHSSDVRIMDENNGFVKS